MTVRRIEERTEEGSVGNMQPICARLPFRESSPPPQITQTSLFFFFSFAYLFLILSNSKHEHAEWRKPALVGSPLRP